MHLRFALIVFALSGCSRLTGSDAESTGATRQAVEATAPKPGLDGPELADTIGEFYTEPVTGIRFPLPAGVGVEVQHFDTTLPVYKFRHLIQLHIEQGSVVFIEIWDNPALVPLEEWFWSNMQFLIQRETRISNREVARARIPAIVLEEPRSPQAISLAYAFFTYGSRVYRVSCVDGDAEITNFPRGLFETVLANLELEVAR